MSKRAIDISTWFSQVEYDQLPETKDIEDPDIDPVPATNPSTTTVLKELYLPDDKLNCCKGNRVVAKLA